MEDRTILKSFKSRIKEISEAYGIEQEEINNFIMKMYRKNKKESKDLSIDEYKVNINTVLRVNYPYHFLTSVKIITGGREYYGDVELKYLTVHEILDEKKDKTIELINVEGENAFETGFLNIYIDKIEAYKIGRTRYIKTDLT